MSNIARIKIINKKKVIFNPTIVNVYVRVCVCVCTFWLRKEKKHYERRIKKKSAIKPKPNVVTMLATNPCTTRKWDKSHPRIITFRNDSTGVEIGVISNINLINGSNETMGNTAPLVNN